MSSHLLQSPGGMEVRVAPLGGVIQSILVPDRDGRLADVVLGFESIDDYRDNPHHIGALIGRYANRIAFGRFVLDGETHELATNNGPHHLHGGVCGFGAVEWRARPVTGPHGSALSLEYTSPDGEEGYPGTLHVGVTYTVTAANALVIDYRAATDRATPINLTQHSYFNLAGHDAGDVGSHLLTLDAESYLPVDETLIPTGELRPVAGTPFDFRTATSIGARIDDDAEQLRIGHGYDHSFVLRDGARATAEAADDELWGRGWEREDWGAFAARLHEPRSGRLLEVWTTEPAVQLYTGNYLDGRAGKGGARYGSRSGVALETQHFADSPNRPAFPSTILRPGVEFRSRTVYRFGVWHE